jgi:hypothetical protein
MELHARHHHKRRPIPISRRHPTDSPHVHGFLFHCGDPQIVLILFPKLARGAAAGATAAAAAITTTTVCTVSVDGGGVLGKRVMR